MHHSSPPGESKAGRFHLSSLLIIPVVLQVALAVGLIGWLLYWGGQRSVNQAVQQLQHELMARVEDKLETYSDIPHSINQLNAIAFAQGNINVTQHQGHYSFWQQMRIYPSVSYIYCGNEQGAFFGVKRSSSDEMQLRISNSTTANLIYVYELDAQGKPGQLLEKRTQSYDPRIRPWYEAAKTAGQPTWSDIYLDFSTLVPTLTASVPVYDPTTATLIGSCATDFYLPSEISEFLRTLSIGENGTAFIMERSGRLVATSTPEPMLIGEGEQTERILAQDSENPTIQTIATELRDRTGFEQLSNLQDLELTVNGKPQFVEVMPFQNRNLDWLIVMAVPRSDFMAPLLNSRYGALGLGLVAVAIALSLGALLAYALRRALVQLTQALNAVKAGTYLTVDPSPIAEVNVLSQSVNALLRHWHALTQERTQQMAVLQQAADYYRQVYERVPAGLFQAAPDGRLLCVNPAMAAIHGYQSPDEMINSVTNISAQLYVNSDDSLEFYRRINQSGQVQNFEHLVYRKDGSAIWVQEDARVVRDSHGKLIYYEGIVQDISERKRLETEQGDRNEPQLSLNDAPPPSR